MLETLGPPREQGRAAGRRPSELPRDAGTSDDGIEVAPGC
jgi:hypothetical protein